MISQNKAFMQPKRVVVPLYTQNKLEILVADNMDVTIGQPLLTNAQTMIYSPVSGTVINLLRIRDKENDFSFHVVIENDLQNRLYPSFQKLSKELLITQYFKSVHRLENLLYVKDHKIVINTLFVNEPFVSLDAKFFEEESDMIYYALKELHEIWAFQEIVLIVKEETQSYFEKMHDLPIKFNVVRPEKRKAYAYEIVNEVFDEALIRDKTYQYLTHDSLLKIYDMLMEHRPMIFTYVVVSGDAVNQQARYKVRVGTPFTSIMRISQGYATDKPKTLTLNALLENINLMHEEFSITHDVYSLHVQEHREHEFYECISCGRCNQHCPVGIFPSKIMHYAHKKLYFDFMQSYRCIECGLCSYYCPSKINVMAFVKEAKEHIRRKKL